MAINPNVDRNSHCSTTSATGEQLGEGARPSVSVDHPRGDGLADRIHRTHRGIEAAGSGPDRRIAPWSPAATARAPVSSGWRHPGRTGALLYAVLAAVLGVAVTAVSRLTVERQRSRRLAAQRLPDGPIIVIANHTSYADGVLLALACRRLGRSLRLLATSGVFRVPILGRVFNRLGFIPVARGGPDAAHALDAAAAALAAGEAVGVFPEGRITRDPNKWPERAKTGAVRLALQSGAPIVPVAMVGAHEVVGRKRVVLRLLKNLLLRPRVDVAGRRPDRRGRPRRPRRRPASGGGAARRRPGDGRADRASSPTCANSTPEHAVGVPRVEAATVE